MRDWLISVPVWGERYVRIFRDATLPALKNALARIKTSFSLVIHTDSPEELRAILGDINVVLKPVPGPDKSFCSMSNAHREVLNTAHYGQMISLLTSDLIVSPEAFVTCERKFREGYLLICCAGMRACEEELPPLFNTGVELLSWGWEHRHPMTQESTWPDGKSYDIWRMYFTDGDNVVCRLALPHPFALIRDNRTITFSPTIDVNVISNFRLKEIYLSTEPNEVSMVELSPKEKEFLYTESMQKRFITKGPSCPSFVKIVNPFHRYMLQKRIKIKGLSNLCGDETVINRFIEG